MNYVKEDGELCKAQFMYLSIFNLKAAKSCETLRLYQQDIEDLDHYEMKEEEPVDGKKSEDDGIEKENLAILEKIRKNQRQDHLNVSLMSGKCIYSSGLISPQIFCQSWYIYITCYWQVIKSKIQLKQYCLHSRGKIWSQL